MKYEFRKGFLMAALPATLLAAGCAAPQEGQTSGPAPATGAPPSAAPAQAGGPSASAPATSGPRTARDGVYTVAQADRGRATYQTSCSACHNTQEFTGTSFMQSWGSRSLGDIHQFISQMMPLDAPGSLTAQQYADIVAYLVRQNGFPAGSTELPTSNEALKQIRFTPQ